jgi:hypothetical protein
MRILKQHQFIFARKLTGLAVKLLLRKDKAACRPSSCPMKGCRRRSQGAEAAAGSRPASCCGQALRTDLCKFLFEFAARRMV